MPFIVFLTPSLYSLVQIPVCWPRWTDERGHEEGERDGTYLTRTLHMLFFYRNTVLLFLFVLAETLTSSSYNVHSTNHWLDIVTCLPPLSSRIQDQLRRLKKIEEKAKKKSSRPQKPKPLTTINVSWRDKYTSNCCLGWNRRYISVLLSVVLIVVTDWSWSSYMYEPEISKIETWVGIEDTYVHSQMNNTTSHLTLCTDAL